MLLAPGARLAVAVAACLISAVLCAWLAVATPWLGVTFAAGPSGAVPVVGAVAPGSPAARAGVRPGDRITALAPAASVPGPGIAIDSVDLLEEPDFLDTWPAMGAFFARQSQLAALLSQPAVRLELAGPAAPVGAPAGTRAVTATPAQRPIGSLPFVFWAQLAFGAAGCLIGVWVWTLRPADPGARVYAATGACFLVFAHAAAVYSARELALPGDLFRTLSAVNHLGAVLFGAALCALFLTFPRPVVGPRGLVALAAAALLWWTLDVTRVAPDQNWAYRFAVLIEMLGAILLATWQWRRARGDPAARAMLRWSGWSVALGCGAFVGLTAAVSAAGRIPPLPQGYAFGFFLLMYAGLALAVARTRVFDLDLWALRLLGWGLGVAAFTALALYLVGAGTAPALRVVGLALLVALAWAPLRRLVWARVTRRGTLAPEDLVDRVLPVAFAASDAERGARWQALLGALFDPLHVTALPDDAPAAVAEPALADDGLVLLVPAVASSPALRLGHPWGGRRLFAGRHLALVRTLVRLLRAADERRVAYERAFERGLQQGVTRGTLGERTRIARDLHDAVSSPLLAGLAPPAAAPTTMAPAVPGPEEIRRAVQQMRTIVSGTAADPAPLADAVADARYDAVRRLRGAGLAVEWPLADLGPAGLAPLAAEARHAFAAFCQEVVTNVLKHAGATRVTGAVSAADAAFSLRLADDGVGFDADATPAGQGLPNLHARAAALGGRVTITRGADGRGTVVHLEAPLAAQEAAA